MAEKQHENGGTTNNSVQEKVLDCKMVKEHEDEIVIDKKNQKNASEAPPNSGEGNELEISTLSADSQQNPPDSVGSVSDTDSAVKPTDSSAEKKQGQGDIEIFKMPLPGNKFAGKSNVFASHTLNSKSVEVDVNEKSGNQKQLDIEERTINNKEEFSKLDHTEPGPKFKVPSAKLPLTSVHYSEPKWGGVPSEPFSFEVIKNGTIIDNMDLTCKSCHMFGRLPSCDVTLEHPSLSRYHAVVQYCIDKTDKRDIGWYLYDLDSTHGTWVNKIKVKPRVYTRIRVGYVVKFGGSTRLFNLQGPSEDKDEESELSVTELKEQRNKQKLEAEILKLADIEEMEKKELTLLKAKEDDGCSWGMDDDAIEDETAPIMAANTQHEDLYIEDPKKGLRGYFEREGLELPEYDLQELGKGKHLCRVELPLDSPTGEPVFAEATTSGKKRDAVVACALEACRILDRYGELRKSNHESRRKKAKNWEDDDYYGSDDDQFLDRTGDIEKKRKIRMKRLGKKREKGLTYDGIVAKLKAINEEIGAIQKELDEAKKQASSYEDAEGGIDALDAFMANIKAGAMDTKTKMENKRRMFELKQEKAKLEKLANIAKPSLPALEKPKIDDKKLSSMIGKMKSPAVRPPRAPIGPARLPMSTSNEEVEEEEDSDEEREKVKLKKKKVPTATLR